MPVAFWFLGRTSANSVTRIISFLLCLSFVALSIYIFPREATNPGLFERPGPSPLWYRGGRTVLL